MISTTCCVFSGACKNGRGVCTYFERLARCFLVFWIRTSQIRQCHPPPPPVSPQSPKEGYQILKACIHVRAQTHVHTHTQTNTQTQTSTTSTTTSTTTATVTVFSNCITQFFASPSLLDRIRELGFQVICMSCRGIL